MRATGEGQVQLGDCSAAYLLLDAKPIVGVVKSGVWLTLASSCVPSLPHLIRSARIEPETCNGFEPYFASMRCTLIIPSWIRNVYIHRI
jgi:hypothetical protein